MPYSSTVNDNAHQIETGENSPQQEITIDGNIYKIDWRSIAPLAAETKGQASTGGRYSLVIAGRSYEVFARRLIPNEEESGQVYEVILGEQRFEVRVEDEREKALTSSVKSTHASGEVKIRAPMPGLVIGVPRSEEHTSELQSHSDLVCR